MEISNKNLSDSLTSQDARDRTRTCDPLVSVDQTLTARCFRLDKIKFFKPIHLPTKLLGLMYNSLLAHYIKNSYYL